MLPSGRVPAAVWRDAHDAFVTDLRALIRIPSVNPPPEPGDGELRAARYVAGTLEAAGIPATVVEPVPGRGSVAARLLGDRTGGEPLLLLSHLDVVPAPPESWTHDPFGADVAVGYVWGRGALDMKAMVAMEVAVLRLLATETRAAGRDPASDAVPGLRRDILLASTADEESGGLHGAGWIVEHRPEWIRAAGALNEAGGVSMTIANRRVYPIQVAEKGLAQYRLTVHGTWGHGSVPRSDNAAVRAAAIVARLAEPGPPRLTAATERLIQMIAKTVDGAAGLAIQRIGSSEPEESERAIADACDPALGRLVSALLRDTVSPNVIQAGVKTNVIPGVAQVEIDCRTLPGTDDVAMRAELERRIGPELWSACDLETIILGEPVESPIDADLYRIAETTLKDHDPEGMPVPAMAPFSTDAKHTSRLGVPTYGFSPLRLEPGDRFVELFHGVDERVSIDALRFGLPVLYDVVRRFCG